MAKDFFKVENCTSLINIPKNGSIHVIGVCGVAMAQIALLLAKRGYNVSGSDKEFYEPMGSLLKNSSVKTFHGYDSGNVSVKSDLVVIGNAISYGNPEVDVVERLNLPYTCFPKILDEVVIGSRHSIVASGTHGKSTTSALIASMLHKMKLSPSYFIGGVAEDLPSSLAEGSGQFCVLEGDEYDSAFFAKVPKFSFYHPDTCIINAVEFDHADIYPNLEAINNEFSKLVNNIPSGGTAIACIDFKNLEELVRSWKESAKCKIITFGEHPEADVRLTSRIQNGLSQAITISSSLFGQLEFSLPIPGAYNAKNGMAALITAHVIGINFTEAIKALSTFKSVKRRQEIRCENHGVMVLEDFAHHPTAVYETVKAVKESFPDKTLWAIFEPRSNTSRRKVFQEDYIKAFAKADQVILSNVQSRAIDTGQELLNVSELSDNITSSGIPCECLDDADQIKNYIMERVGRNDIILIMSNGSFGGLIQMLVNDVSAMNGV